MNHERIYKYRFRNIDQAARAAVWGKIAPHVHGIMGNPQTVLDPAAGRAEFICAIDAAERWAVDEVAHAEAERAEGVRYITANIMDAELPREHFDGVFVSNFLEHLHDQEQIANFLDRMREVMRRGGRIGIMGPNYRYCSREYWDMADHWVALTHLSVAEHLFGAGFEPIRVVPRYLPYSFNGILPPSPALTGAYLHMPLAWRVLGKQFLVVGRRD